MLISKKDLLDQTGISYGQLYRWKREKLIPEEWFIKRSSFTGQETFFPKTKILARIQAIQELKDKYSLEELARILSPEVLGAPLLREGSAPYNRNKSKSDPLLPQKFSEAKFHIHRRFIFICPLKLLRTPQAAAFRRGKYLPRHPRKPPSNKADRVPVHSFRICRQLLHNYKRRKSRRLSGCQI